MKIKQFEQSILAMICCMLLFSCEKEVAVEAVEFGKLNISNKTKYIDDKLNLTYDGIALQKSTSGLSNIKIPLGKGKLSISDSTGNLLDTLLTIEANKIKDLILFQPTADLKPLFVENDQANEALPDVGYLKIKAVNFATHAFSRPVDIVFNFKEPGGGIKPVPSDTLENVYFGQHIKINKLLATNVQGSIFFIDSQTKEKLTTRLILFNCPKNIYTIYIVEGEGVAVVNTTYKVTVKTLFEN